MKYRSSKGTTIDIPDHLSPKDIAAIKADADAGYGTRAQQTANNLGKGGASAPAADSNGDGVFSTEGKSPAELQAMLTRTKAEIARRGAGKAKNFETRLQQIQTALGAAGVTPPLSESLGPDGNIDLNNAAATQEETRKADEDAQFKLDHPDETDQYGNTVSYSRNPDGSVKRTITQGDTAKKFTELATAAASSFHGDEDRKSAEDATYSTLTQYYDRDQAREMEDQKQELANRGIPYDPAAAQDPNSKNLYGRTIGGISQKWQGLKDDASQKAVVAGNQAYATTSAARDSFLTAVTSGANTFGNDFGEYVNRIQKQTGNDDLALLSMSAEQYARLRGLSLSEAQSKRDDATRRAAIAKSGSGGGGGGSSKPKEPAAGFEIVG